MNRTILRLTALVFSAALTACASPDYAQYSKAQTDIATARASADAERYKAFAAIAQTGDATAKVAAVMAMAMGAGGQPQTPQIAAPQPNQALQWASILVPSLTQVAGMRYQYLGQQTASNNATALGLSTNNAFVGLGAKIQAPGAVSNSTNILSGTGVLGSGAYSPVDRNDVTNTTQAAPITPVVQVVPTVITPIVNTPPTVITPVIQPPVTVIPPVFPPAAP